MDLFEDYQRFHAPTCAWSAPEANPAHRRLQHRGLPLSDSKPSFRNSFSLVNQRTRKQVPCAEPFLCHTCRLGYCIFPLRTPRPRSQAENSMWLNSDFENALSVQKEA